MPDIEAADPSITSIYTGAPEVEEADIGIEVKSFRGFSVGNSEGDIVWFAFNTSRTTYNVAS